MRGAWIIVVAGTLLACEPKPRESEPSEPAPSEPAPSETQGAAAAPESEPEPTMTNPEPEGPRLPLALELTIVGDILQVVLVNTSSDELRLWARANTWGDGSWAVVLQAGGRRYVLRPTQQGYTRNVPRVLVVPAGGRHTLELQPKSREWTAGEDLASLRELELELQVELDIAASPEASEQRVMVGHARSEVLVSQPPHPWLF